MRSNIARANFILLVLVSVALLAVGWLTAYASQPTRAALFELHVSLGVIAAAVITAQIVLRIIVPPPPHPARWPGWRRTTGGLSEFLVYVSFLAIVASGLLWAAFSGTPLHVFGAPLPVSDVVDRPLAQILGPLWGAPLRAAGAAETMASEIFLSAHGLLAFLLAGSILAHLCVGAPSRFREPGATLRALKETPAVPASRSVLGLAGRLRVLGWIQFWLQLAIVLASAVLLQFSTSGRAISPSASGYGDAIYWSLYGFLLLCAADALAFFYTRAANGIVMRPDYLSGARMTAFWFLTAGLLIGLAGTVISFVGVSLSISLLIAKTVSQPPGIAITDPNKIIRALDIFVLLVNFILLLAHFIGTGVAAWLGAGVSNARFRYVERTRLPAEGRA